MVRDDGHSKRRARTEAEEALWGRYAACPDVTARNALAMHYQPLLRRVASGLAQSVPVELEELVADGQAALLGAIERFDPDRCSSFRAFACRRLRGAMLDAMRERDYLPRTLRRAGGLPGLASLDASLGALGNNGDNQPVTLGDCLAAPMTADARRAEARAALASYLPGCNRGERLILLLRYQEAMTLTEIGEVLGVGESRVSQILQAMLGRLKRLVRRRQRQQEAQG